MAYEKLGFTDGVTPLDAEHFNHMEEGIAKANDLIDDSNTDTLNWDGDITDKVTVDKTGDGSLLLVHVSDCVPTEADLANGVSYAAGMHGINIGFHINGADAQSVFENGYAGFEMEGETLFIIVPVDNFEKDGLVYPKRGVYFLINPDIDLFVSSIMIPGYNEFKQDAKVKATAYCVTNFYIPVTEAQDPEAVKYLYRDMACVIKATRNEVDTAIKSNTARIAIMDTESGMGDCITLGIIYTSFLPMRSYGRVCVMDMADDVNLKIMTVVTAEYDGDQ